LAALNLAEVEVDSLGNVFARRPGGPAPPTLVTAHTDTVFPRETDLTLTQTADRLAGPGIGDNALGVAGLFALVESLNAAGLTTPGDLWVCANVGEEGLGDLRGMRAAMRRFGGRVRATLIIEGMAYGHIYCQAIGVHRLRVTAHAAGGHSWHNNGAASAVHGLVQLGAQILALPLPAQPRTALNIGEIRGGTSVNTIARQAAFDLDLRSEEPAALAVLVNQVRAAIERAATPELSFTTQVTSQRPAGVIPRTHPLVQLAASTLRGLGTEPNYESGSTDANIPLSLGEPAIVIGLCRGGHAHRPDEYIETEFLSRGVEQLIRVVLGTYDL
jgi:acetylornithine deacetylase/succinyl-diaminopimelate desuccinylase-like protein